MDSFTHRNGGVTAESRIKNADILCKIKYTNNLPDIPFDAKFIKYTFDNSRFINYKPTSLEKSHKWDIQNDIDLEVSVDLINRQLYKIGPEPAVLHPDDEKLLEDEPVNRANAHRAELNARIVPWLRKTEYIGSTNQMNISRDSNLDSSRSTKIKKRVEESINFPSREQQIETIEKSFDDAQKLIENHYSKPHVHKIAEWYIFPDEEIWPFPCSQVIFDDDPTPNGFEMDATKLTSEALIRAITDHNDEQFMGYFLPDHQSLEKLTNSDDSKLPENKEYFFRMNRDYNWNVKGSSTQQGEESYFVIFNDDKVTYAPFDTRIRLNKRRKQKSKIMNAEMYVQYRPLSEREMQRQERRMKELSSSINRPYDSDEDLDEDESGEEEVMQFQDNDDNPTSVDADINQYLDINDHSEPVEEDPVQHSDKDSNPVISADDDPGFGQFYENSNNDDDIFADPNSKSEGISEISDREDINEKDTDDIQSPLISQSDLDSN